MVTGGRSRRRRGKGAKDPMDMVFRSIRRNEEARGKGKANPSAKLKISGRNEKQEARSKKKDATKKAAPKGERMKVVAPPKEPPKKAKGIEPTKKGINNFRFRLPARM